MEDYLARPTMTQEKYKPIQALKERAKGDENKQRRIANLIKHKEFVELFQLIVEIDGAACQRVVEAYKQQKTRWLPPRRRVGYARYARALRAAALCGHVDLVDLPQSLAAAFRYLQDRLRPYALARRDVVYI